MLKINKNLIEAGRARACGWRAGGGAIEREFDEQLAGGYQRTAGGHITWVHKFEKHAKRCTEETFMCLILVECFGLRESIHSRWSDAS